MGERRQITTIQLDPRVEADLREWVKQFHEIANFRDMKTYMNKLRHCLLGGIIDHELFTKMIYSAQVESVVMREALIEGGGTQLTEAVKNRETFARMTDDELKDYLAERNTVKRIEMINNLDRKGQIVDAELVQEIPTIKIKVSKPSQVAQKVKNATPKTGLLAPKPPPAPPPDEDLNECPI